MKELIPKAVIDELKDLLVQRRQSLSVAESVTAGIVQALCSAATNAAAFFQGGITVYNLGQKTLHLGVDPIRADQCDCVSEDTASQMATGACRLFRSEWSISITGYASPTPESDNQLFAYVAIAFNDEVVLIKRIEPAGSDFFEVQLEYATKAISFLKQEVKKR